jgi:hypothetical protein
MEVSDYREELTLFIISLAQGNPVILGLPWLCKHNPRIDWKSLQLKFTKHYHRRCLLYQIESQIMQQATANVNEEVQLYKHYHATVENEADSDKEDNNTTNKGTMRAAITRATSKGDMASEATVTAATTNTTREVTMRAVVTSGGDGSADTTGRSDVKAVTTNATSEPVVRAVLTSRGDGSAVTTRRSDVMAVTTSATSKGNVRAVTTSEGDVGAFTTGRSDQ